KRIVEQIPRRVAAHVPIGPRGRIHAQHMVGRLQEIVAHGLDRLCVVTHDGCFTADVAEWNECAELHLLSPPSYRRPARPSAYPVRRQWGRSLPAPAAAAC